MRFAGRLLETDMLMPNPKALSRLVGNRKKQERRTAIRCAPFRLAPCYLYSPTEGIGASVWIYNLSAIGVGLVGCPRLSPGTMVNVELTNASYMRTLAVDMFIIRVEAVKAGDHYIGGQFTRKLTYNELLAFLV
jgi:hypothetical protein